MGIIHQLTIAGPIIVLSMPVQDVLGNKVRGGTYLGQVVPLVLFGARTFPSTMGELVLKIKPDSAVYSGFCALVEFGQSKCLVGDQGVRVQLKMIAPDAPLLAIEANIHECCGLHALERVRIARILLQPPGHGLGRASVGRTFIKRCNPAGAGGKTGRCAGEHSQLLQMRPFRRVARCGRFRSGLNAGVQQWPRERVLVAARPPCFVQLAPMFQLQCVRASGPANQLLGFVLVQELLQVAYPKKSGCHARCGQIDAPNSRLSGSA